MRGSNAKILRQAVVPGREETGMSRGAFIRMLTQYETTIHRVVRYPKAHGGEDFEVPYHTTTLKADCPRGMLRKFMRMNNDK